MFQSRSVISPLFMTSQYVMLFLLVAYQFFPGFALSSVCSLVMDEGNTDLIEGLPHSQVFTTGLRHEDVSNVLITQHNLLSRLEKTNAMLQTVNELSTHRLDSLASQLRASTRLLVSMKRELITILRRTDSVRKTLMKQYPTAYELASSAIESAWKAELEDEPMATSSPQPLTLTQTMFPLTE